MSAEKIIPSENLSPIFTSFETIFNALEEPLPEPNFFMQLGYKGPSPEFDVEPCLRASFEGIFLKARVFGNIDIETKDEIIKLAEEQVNNFSHEDRYNQLSEPIEGKIVIEAGDAPVSREQWKLLYPKDAAVSVFHDNLSFDSERVSCSLDILAPDKLRPPHDSLFVEFPENNLRELNLLAPRVDFRNVLEVFQTELAREHSQRVGIFAQAISRELSPVWLCWYKLQASQYQYNPKALEILGRAYNEADKNLRFAANLLNK